MNMDFEKLGEAAFNARYPISTDKHPRFWSEIDNKDRHINVAKAVIEASGLLPELTTLRERVKELELLLDGANSMHNRIAEIVGDSGQYRDGSRGQYRDLEEAVMMRISNLEQRIEALESTHNRKGPKVQFGMMSIGEGGQATPVYICAECSNAPTFTYSIDVPNGDRCAQCGRVL